MGGVCTRHFPPSIPSSSNTYTQIFAPPLNANIFYIGGDLNNFLPIIVGDTDSSPASDLTLSQALKQIIVKTNKRTGQFFI